MKKILIKGKVFSSKGEGKKFLDLPWVKKQIEESLGFTPYSGTLNLCLLENGVQKKLLAKANRAEVRPEKGYCTGVLIKAQIGNLECAIVLPQVPSYPIDVLEIIAPINLREHFKLKDGDQVSLTVTL